LSATTSAANRTTAVADPYRNFNFRVSVQNREDIYFTECSGIGVRVQTIRYRESGSSPRRVLTLPGAVDYTDVVLRWGLSTATSDYFWAWLNDTLNGRDVRYNLTITALAYDGSTAGPHWNLRRALPKEWRAASFDALGHDVAVEELRLAYDEITRD
jgi:phage tail-like protein